MRTTRPKWCSTNKVAFVSRYSPEPIFLGQLSHKRNRTLNGSIQIFRRGVCFLETGMCADLFGYHSSRATLSCPACDAPHAPHFNRRSDAMLPVEEAILDKLRSGPCAFDEVVTYLPSFSWGEIFVAVDSVSRDGRVFLRQLGFSTYEISLRSPDMEVISGTGLKVMQGSLSG